MIYERSIFIFTCIVSSILATCSVEAAIESEKTLWESVAYSQILSKSNSDNGFKPKNIDRAIITQESQSVERQDNSQTGENPVAIKKRWMGLALVVTSIVFLLVLWVLFQPHPKKKAEITVTKLSNGDEQDRPDLLDLDLPAKSESNLPTLFISKESDEQSVAETAQIIQQRRIHPNPTLSEDPRNFASEDNPVQINSVNEPIVRIMTSKTTEIDVVFELIQDLSASDRHLRRKAIWELARIGDSRSIEPLVNIIPQVDALDKSLIINALTQIAHRNFELIHNFLFTSLEDNDPEVRQDAIRDLTALHEPTSLVTQRLSIMLKDPDKEVRKTAQWALNKINSGYSLTQSYTTNNNDVVSSRGNPER